MASTGRHRLQSSSRNRSRSRSRSGSRLRSRSRKTASRGSSSKRKKTRSHSQNRKSIALTASGSPTPTTYESKRITSHQNLSHSTRSNSTRPRLSGSKGAPSDSSDGRNTKRRKQKKKMQLLKAQQRQPSAIPLAGSASTGRRGSSITPKSSSITKAPSTDLACTSAKQGLREYMEDRYASFQLPDGTLIKAVFDGHGLNMEGKRPAEYAKRTLVKRLAAAAQDWFHPLQRGNGGAAVSTRKPKPTLAEIRKKWTEVCVTWDEELYRKFGWAKDNGTTAVWVMIPSNENRIYLANVGDSRAVIYDEAGKVMESTRDHKPDDRDEKIRIQNAGGFVRSATGNDHTARVDGMLAMSRSLGDHYLKSHDSDGSLQLDKSRVIPVPFITSVDLTPSGYYYVVLASDGLWDVMDNQSVGRWLVERIRAQTESTSTSSSSIRNWNRFCDELGKHALALGSSDNICITILRVRI